MDGWMQMLLTHAGRKWLARQLLEPKQKLRSRGGRADGGRREVHTGKSNVIMAGVEEPSAGGSL